MEGNRRRILLFSSDDSLSGLSALRRISMGTRDRVDIRCTIAPLATLSSALEGLPRSV